MMEELNIPEAGSCATSGAPWLGTDPPARTPETTIKDANQRM
jgi:hypothetical protein